MTAFTEKSVASIPFFSAIWLGCSGDVVLDELEPPSDELPEELLLDEDFWLSADIMGTVEIEPDI